MTQEDKELLLKDLSARLLYGVKCTTKSMWDGIYTIEGYRDNRFFLDCPVYDEGDDEWMIESIVPYLRPMSSMTEEEFAEYEKANDLDTLDSSETLRENMKAKHRVRISKWYHGADWLNAHHFDYRGLIKKGLAIAVTEENNPYKE